MLNKKITNIISALNREYGTKNRVFLNHETPWQLLIATILSAQCTDDRVNQVTSKLFKKYRSIEDFANADQEELEKDIHSTGFYKNKAKNIIACTKRLLSEYGGIVPRDIDDLISLAGVGRKTANVIRGNIYNEPSIVVDTHVKRVSRRLGLTKEEDPVKIEFDLMEKLPKAQWILYNIQIISHGRAICTARSPKCEECFLKEFCTYGLKVGKKISKNENKSKNPLKDELK
ncbi:MAG: endonuclease III [Clostridiales bacterium]|mgnify:CR=1 FL=1|jgi:endonuclease-3|nr:endonuclease III [Bacillota bacterium]NLK04106.1 endonuclease III [Clostridiales bacterium]